MGALAREPRHGSHLNELRRFLNKIQNHKQAWPFLSPVNKDEVPGYYQVIESPMGLSAREKRLESNSYAARKDLVNDLKFYSFTNCCKYNDPTTVYAKCESKLEQYMWPLVREIPESFELLED